MPAPSGAYQRITHRWRTTFRSTSAGGFPRYATVRAVEMHLVEYRLMVFPLHFREEKAVTFGEERLRR
jgi:hypothetical protein